MKKIAVAGIAALALALTACGGAGGTTSPTASSLAPVTMISSTTATPTASATASSTTSTVAATTTTGAEVAENVDYPAQADMTRLGARAETVVPFQDNQGRYWLCDQSNPTGETNKYVYTNPNGCDGPYDSEQALVDDIFNPNNIAGVTVTTPPAPQPRAEQDIADGIARDLGCEGAVLNETTGAFEYFGCE